MYQRKVVEMSCRLRLIEATEKRDQDRLAAAIADAELKLNSLHSMEVQTNRFQDALSAAKHVFGMLAAVDALSKLVATSGATEDQIESAYRRAVNCSLLRLALISFALRF